MSDKKPTPDQEMNPDAQAIAHKRAAAKKAAIKKAQDKKIQAKQEAQTTSHKEEWHNPKGDWSKGQVQKAEAHLTTLFETDEQLPLSKHLLLMSVALFFVVFVVWANWASLDEIARGEGKVIPASKVQEVNHPEAAIIEEFLVSEGQIVNIGDVLVRLSDIQASSDLGANEARYYGLLAAITRLQAEANGEETVTFPDEVRQNSPDSVIEERNAFNANRKQNQAQYNILQQQKAQREQEVRELETRITDLRAVLTLQEEEKSLIEPLVRRGSAPQMELLQLERTIREKKTELNAALTSLPRAKSAIEEVAARINDLESTAQAEAQVELTAKQVELNEIKERLFALKDRKERTTITSPVNGTVQELTVNTIGSVVRAQEPIVKIVPKDDQLVIEAKIKPSDRAFIYEGQKAIIKLTAYDFSIYGGLDASVEYISPDTQEDEKQGEFYFVVRLRTLESELRHDGETLPILPGMIASVDILTGEKTVMQYLLKPFIKTLDTAFSER